MILLGFLLLNRRRQKSGFIGDVLMTALTESKRKKNVGVLWPCAFGPS
jgi:hypothetical protein